MFYNKGFEEATLGSERYFEIIMGQSPPGTSYNKAGKGMPFFQGKKEFGEKYPSIEQWTTEPSKIAFPNDILISVRAPVGAINMTNIDCCIGRGLASIRCNKEISKDFVYSFLKLKEKEIENLGNGSTFKAITSKQLRDIKIPIPPLLIQQKFTNIVEQVEKMKEEIKKTKNNSEELFDSLMQKAFRGELIWELLDKKVQEYFIDESKKVHGAEVRADNKIYVESNFERLPRNEQLAIIYHERGHSNFKLLSWIKLIQPFQLILFVLLFFMAIIYILIAVLTRKPLGVFGIFGGIFLLFSIVEFVSFMFFNWLLEVIADLNSTKNIDKKILISQLKSLYARKDIGFWRRYIDHPPIKLRIKIMEAFD